MSDQSEREIVVEERPEVPWLSMGLGFGPMLPVVAGAIVVWTNDHSLRGEAILFDALYAGSILAFLAGVRRGLSFRTERGPAPAQLVTMAGLWLTAFLSLACIAHALAIPALALLTAGYLAMAVLDPLAAQAGQVPLFFARLRPPQMLVAAFALAATLANVWMHA